MFPNFKPARWLRNAHLQTVWSSLFAEVLPPYRATPHELELSDGDRVVLHDDIPAGWQNGDPIALLSHGLTGCHQSSYVVRLAAKLNERGFRTFRKDMRNCGAGFGLARYPYHAGRSGDLLESLDYIHDLAPESPISLVGFSLSGNIVLRTIAENPDELPDYLATAVAVNPPIDLSESVRSLKSMTGRIYDRYFTGKLIKHVIQLQEHLPEHFPLETMPRTLTEFDDVITAPLSGFESARQYYRLTSAKEILHQINLPSLVLTANDDPLVPVKMFKGLESHDAITLYVSPHGGHLGYRGRPGADPDQHWMDWRVLEWLERCGREVHASKATYSLEDRRASA